MFKTVFTRFRGARVFPAVDLRMTRYLTMSVAG
jgi:hypothetical protein